MDILSSHNGSEVAGLINEALADAGIATTIGNESGSVASGKLNEVFGDALLDDTQSGSEWTQTVEEGLEGIDQEPNTFKFLHVSDVHGSDAATKVAKGLIAEDDSLQFLFVTGDMTAYGQTDGINSGLATDFTDIGNKLLLNAGNHDVYDNKFGTTSRSQQATTNFLKGWLQQRVTWGDTNGIASYWHKDFPLPGGAKLRLISLDQYEIDVCNLTAQFSTTYSQAQVDWLIGLLKGLSSNDYVIIATHEPPIQSPAQPSGESPDTYPDQYAVGIRPSEPYYTNGELNEPLKLFVTEGLKAFGNRRNEPSMNLLPRIMKAYMDKSALSLTYTNRNGNNTPIVIDEVFSDEPATFLFFMGGHRHADICYYLPDESTMQGGDDWSDQLMLYVTCSYSGTSGQVDDDLNINGYPVNGDPIYRINEIELDFVAKTIKVTRIGAQNTAGGRVRNEVIFPFKKNQE